jgi:uncharacterized protein
MAGVESEYRPKKPGRLRKLLLTIGVASAVVAGLDVADTARHPQSKYSDYAHDPLSLIKDSVWRARQIWDKTFEQKPSTERTPVEQRKFTSQAVEDELARVASQIADPDLRKLFINSWPNTLDTLVDPDGTGYIITGDIPYMWIRDSAAQLLAYLPVLDKSPELQKLYRATIARQAKNLTVDPRAGTFNKDYQVVDGRWELDSPSWFIRLSNSYYEKTGDKSIFTPEWENAASGILNTLKEEQIKNGNTTGLVSSDNRPSDWVTTYPYNIPDNIFATIELDNLAQIITNIYNNPQKAQEITDLSNQIKAGIEKFGIVEHPKYGRIYAYEVDGMGKILTIDDANVPDLLSLAYLHSKYADDPVYQNTIKFVLSSDNPNFVSGKLGKGLASYNGPDQFWQISLCTIIMISNDENDIRESLRILLASSLGTGFMHESVQKDGEDGVVTDGFHIDWFNKLTRREFGWANGYFGEAILRVARDYPHILQELFSASSRTPRSTREVIYAKPGMYIYIEHGNRNTGRLN